MVKSNKNKKIEKTDSIKENQKKTKVANNPWAVSTIILSILLIISVIALISSSLNRPKMTIIDKDSAAKKVINFTNENINEEIELVNSSNYNDYLYEVVLSYKGQELPVHVTKDGKILVTTMIPLDEDLSEKKEQTTNQQTQQTQNIPKSDKPKVELFVMSHCPYGTQIEKGILPVIGLLKDKIDFELKFVYYAMHPSQGEVEEQLKQYCIQKEQKDKFLDYLKCFLKEGKSDECTKEAKLNEVQLKSCIQKTDKEFNVTANLKDKSKWLNEKFPLFNIHKEDNEKYGIQGSPTLVINGVKVTTARDSSSLLKTICSAFNAQPSECSQNLPSETPSPGFGFTTTQAGAVQATCG